VTAWSEVRRFRVRDSRGRELGGERSGQGSNVICETHALPCVVIYTLDGGLPSLRQTLGPVSVSCRGA